MRKILSLLFAVMIVQAAQSQAIINGRYHNNVNAWYKYRGIKLDSNLMLPTIIPYFGYEPGAVYANLSDSSIYLLVGATWVKQRLGGSGGGGSADSSIFATQYRLDTTRNGIRSILNLKLNISDTANMRPRLYAGANVTITGTYPNITIAASGGGGGSIDSVLMASKYRVDTVAQNIRNEINAFASIEPDVTFDSMAWRKSNGDLKIKSLGYESSGALLIEKSATGNTDSTLKLKVTLNSGGGTSNFLRADGTWAAPSGGGGSGDSSWVYINADSVRLSRINTNLSDSTSAYGDSFTEGFGIDPIDSAYIYRLEKYYFRPVKNNALGGTGIYTGAAHHLTHINPGHKGLTSVMYGLNDIRYGGGSSTTMNRVVNGFKAIITNHFLKSYVTGGAGAGVTRYGTWTTSYNATTYGGKTTAGAYSTALNDSIVYLFTDSTIAVGLIGTDGSGTIYNGAAYEVYIDNSLVYSGTLNLQTNNTTSAGQRTIPTSFITTGLTNALHSIKIVQKTAGNYLYIDYFGHLMPSTSAMPMMVYHVPKMNATGYATSPANASDIVTDSVNNKIDSLYGQIPFAYRNLIKKVPTNSYYSVTTGISSDNIHPSSTGHRQIAAGAATVYPYPTSPVNEGSMYYDGQIKFKTGLGLRNIATVEDLPLYKKFIDNNNTTAQDAGFNINHFSYVNNQFQVGKSTLASATETFKVKNFADYNLVFKRVSTTQYMDALNDAGTGGTSLALRGATFSMDRLSSGGTSKVGLMTMPATGDYMTFNSVANIGTVSNTDNAFTLGILSATTFPYYSMRYASGGTNEKIWDHYTAGSTLTYRLVNDANSAATVWMEATRSATTLSTLKFTSANTYLSGNLKLGSTSGTPSANLELAAGTTTIAPMKLTTGTALTTPADGSIEYHSSHLYFTIGSTRYQLDRQGDVTQTGTQTLTNKRFTARVGSTTSSATPTINTDNYDIYKLTAQAANITSFTTNLTGTPVDGDVFEVQITGTAARTITWGASFVSSTVTLPATTVTTATLTVVFQYYTTSSYGNNKWVCVNYY